jgi:DNA-binding transcriptional MerR regulator
MYRIGEFSRIAQVPGSLLRYYDRIGLFSPERVDEWTGYRYYSAQQLPDLNRILTLKGLGLPLEQVRRMLDDAITPEEIRAMLTLRKSQIERSLEQEFGRLRTIESRLEQLERGAPGTAVVIKAIPAQPTLALRRVFDSGDEAFDVLTELSRVVPEKTDRSILGNPFAIMHSEVLDPDDLDLELGYTLERPLAESLTLPDGAELIPSRLAELPAAVTAARVGGLEGSHEAYGALGVWAEANRYRLVAPSREVFLAAPRPGNLDEMIAEIQFPAEAIASSETAPTAP